MYHINVRALIFDFFGTDSNYDDTIPAYIKGTRM